jgi:hypothetical protein
MASHRTTVPSGRRLLWILGLAAGTLTVLLLLLGGTAGAQEDQRFDNEFCLGCHGNPGMTTELPGGETLDIHVDPALYEESVHGELDLPCVLCHTDITGYPHDPITATSLRAFTVERNDVCADCHIEQFTETRDNVHTEALLGGNLEAAVCSDCHGAHTAKAPVTHSPEIPLTCQTCHSEIYDLYEESVHGEALETGNQDVPTCTDCHGVHDLDGPAPDSPFHLYSPQICAECHDDPELMDEYGISTAVFDTYIADFHGTTVTLFEELAPDQETNKPVCIDCHGVHAIKPADDPDSTVNETHLLQTCQRCHPDAEENFPASWLSHYIPEPGRASIVWGATLFYQILIPAVIGAMALFVVLNWLRRYLDRRKAAHG